jgi:hypothetical protein
MIVKLTKPVDQDNFCSMISWLFTTFGSPPTKWRLHHLDSVYFENREDGIYFKLVWSQI